MIEAQILLNGYSKGKHDYSLGDKPMYTRDDAYKLLERVRPGSLKAEELSWEYLAVLARELGAWLDDVLEELHNPKR